MARQKIIKEKLLYLSLEKTTKRIREIFNNIPAIKSNSLSLEQWLIIELIGKNEGIHQKKIVAILSKEPASISRLVNKLISRNIIEKIRDDNDKKVLRLSLSDIGLKLYEDNKKAVDKTFKDIFSTIFERELYLVMDILNRIED